MRHLNILLIFAYNRYIFCCRGDLLIRGSQKKIIVLHNTGSYIFDEAYFVIKDSSTAKSKSDMIREANKIIEENSLRRRKKTKNYINAICFVLGTLFGAGIVGAVWALVAA